MLGVVLEEVGFFLRHVPLSRRERLYLYHSVTLLKFMALITSLEVNLYDGCSVRTASVSRPLPILLSPNGVHHQQQLWLDDATVLQLSVVRIILLFVTLRDPVNPHLYVNGIIVCPPLCLFYRPHLMFYKATKRTLPGYGLRAKFICIIMVFCCWPAEQHPGRPWVLWSDLPSRVIVEMFCIGLYDHHTFRKVEPSVVEEVGGVCKRVEDRKKRSDGQGSGCASEALRGHLAGCRPARGQQPGKKQIPQDPGAELTHITVPPIGVGSSIFAAVQKHGGIFESQLKGVAVSDCSVACKMSWEELECLCRREKVHCKELGVNRANVNEYEVEFLCDYKKNKEVTSVLVQKAKLRQCLQRWEAHLNHTRNHPGRIFVVNDVDFEGPPKNFTYINNYKVGQGIILDEMAVGCECKKCLEEPINGCCPGASLHRMAYNDRGQSGAEGIQFDLCIFKTENGRGWGVRTLQHIKKNTFVMEYVGEGSTYLFDLDYVEDVYTVDAAHLGNISHFVNHSCNPNLQVFNVFIDNIDERLPRIALFSTRAIRAGEELTFDYKMQIDPVDTESTKMDSSFSLAGLPSSPKKRIRVECRCGSDSCRKYLF
ncbi:hypothetical protein INR49_008014 [Caranx melampygus]|nr:hypothetical protein INR49_008014 [Caranx melampygus]